MDEKMIGIHLLGKGKISIDELLKPAAKGNNVVVKIKAAGICGTDRHPLLEEGQEKIPGHENAGEIVEVDKTSWARVGDGVALNCHVTCRACEHCLRGDLYFCDHLEVLGYEWDGGFAEYILVPEDNCMPLPEDISMEDGALIVDVLGTAYQGIKRANLLPGDKVAVWGGGPIGFEAAAVATFLGAKVAVLDMNPYRLEMAKKYNQPDLVLNPLDSDTEAKILDWTEGRGLDMAFECVGNESAAQQAMRVLKKRGTLAIIGVSHRLCVDPWDMIQREISITTSRNFNTHEFNEMIALIRNGLWADKVVTHRFPLKEADAAFKEFLNGQCGKIVFEN
jgi:2-desacetyl-2-hydroxyethyl bacteriochlorophyllide A dehydrogenase